MEVSELQPAVDAPGHRFSFWELHRMLAECFLVSFALAEKQSSRQHAWPRAMSPGAFGGLWAFRVREDAAFGGQGIEAPWKP